MAKNTTPSASQKRKPRLLWANPFCLLDTSSGASMTVRQMLKQLVKAGYEIEILGSTIFDNPKGAGLFKEKMALMPGKKKQLMGVNDDELVHQLVITKNSYRNELTVQEESKWFSQYCFMLDDFKPDIVWFYGGQTLDLLIADEARSRGIASAFYLANGHYTTSPRWCRDIDLVLCDSQATARMYQEKVGFTATPLGKFIDEKQFVAENHEPKRLLFVNPSFEKGASIVVQLALQLEKARPDIEIEVVEARADWQQVLGTITRKLGEERSSLPNVIVTPNTSDMRDPYSRARVLLAPSLWWESSGRVLAEAMLNGIPAIVTNRGGMPEMIDDAGIKLDFPEACYEKPYQHLLSQEELAPLVEAVTAFYDDEGHYQSYVERAERVGRKKHHISVSTKRLTEALAPLVAQKAGNKDFRVSQRKLHKHRLAGTAAKPTFASEVYVSPPPPAQQVVKVSAAPKPTLDFDWQLSSKVVVLDNRAKLIKTGTADKLVKTNAFTVLAFDPASEVANQKAYEGHEHVQLFQHALLGDGQPAKLNACLDAALTSTLALLPECELPKHRRAGAKVLTQLPINTIALDSIEGLPSLDWLILDELSNVSNILKFGEKALKDTLLIQARVAFQPTHENQPNLAELQQWASRNGFRFYRFNDMSYRSLINKGLANDRSHANVLESADALFIPSENKLETLSDSQKIKLAFILDAVFQAKDISLFFLDLVAKKENLPLKNKERFFVNSVNDPELYIRSIQAVFDQVSKVRIVQVGANDGCINDPIYNVVMRNKYRSKIILIEPQSNIIPYLEKNYVQHPDAYVANYAVGAGSALSLYRIKPSFYSLFVKRYLKDSPSYRVPSGFASFDKNHVIKHVEGNLHENTNIQDAIEKITIPSHRLLEIMQIASWEESYIDVLQVDAEGMDDEVIYACDIELTKPKLINFERIHLSNAAYKKLCKYLCDLNYELYHYGSADTLAIIKPVKLSSS